MSNSRMHCHSILQLLVIELLLLWGTSSPAQAPHVALPSEPTRTLTVTSSQQWLWVQTAYNKRNGRAYDRLLRVILSDARHLNAKQAASREEALLVWVNKNGAADGLEPVLLAYWDCAKGERTPTLNKKLGAVRFKNSPAPHMYMRMGSCQRLYDRRVRGEAVRAVFGNFAKAQSATQQEADLRNLLKDASISSALCQVPPRKNQCGQVSAEDLIREEACRQFGVPGGPGILEQLCQQEQAREAANGSEASTFAAGAPTGTGPNGDCGPKTLSGALQSACNMAAGASNGGAASGDGLDSSAEATCVAGTSSEVTDTNKIAQLMNDCYGDPTEQTANKLAEDGAGSILWDHIVGEILEHTAEKLGDVALAGGVSLAAAGVLWLEGMAHVYTEIFQEVDAINQQQCGRPCVEIVNASNSSSSSSPGMTPSPPMDTGSGSGMTPSPPMGENTGTSTGSGTGPGDLTGGGAPSIRTIPHVSS